MDLKNFLFGSISRKLIFILGTLVLLIVVVFGAIVYFQNEVLEDEFFANVVQTENGFISIKEKNIETLSVALEVILQDEKIKEIYLEKDRQKLFDHSQSLFQDLKNKYEITHFYFILPDGHNFVRIHNENVYGDLIQRATFLESMRTRSVAAGIELGKTAYALRVVMPYYNKGELIGYVELGQEIDGIFEHLGKVGGGEFALAVEKNSLSKDDWEFSREVRGLRNNWEDLRDYVVISSTTEEKPSCFSSENSDILRSETKIFEQIGLENKTFICGGFALTDAFGEESGAIFSLIDVTGEQSIMDNIGMIFLIIILVIIFFFLWMTFFISENISMPIIKLDLAAKDLQNKKFDTRVDINTGDELELLGESFNHTAKALEGMDNEYKRLEKAKTEFLSITSHELRSPMTPMQAQLQMLLGDYYGKLNKKQRDAMEIVSRNTKRLDNIIVDFLEISRIEAARLKFRFVKDDPTKVILRVIKEMQGFMPEKKIKIVTQLDKLPIIEHDPDRLSQVIRNLINNAKKFSKVGTTITVAAKLKDEMIQFSVEDQGVGINQEDKMRIFEPFYQAEQTIYREHQGTGLGLAIIKGIVESQNGKVWVESAVGKKTVFYFTIPLKPVREIRPIRLLFSSKENISRGIKSIFLEMLGPMGLHEFENLEFKSQLSKKDLIWYIDVLIKKGVLTVSGGELFKRKISILFGEKVTTKETKGLKVQDLLRKGLIKSDSLKKQGESGSDK